MKNFIELNSSHPWRARPRARMRRDVAGDQVTDHDAGTAAVDDDHVEHLRALVEPHGTEPDLTGERLIRTEEKLLSGLAPR